MPGTVAPCRGRAHNVETLDNEYACATNRTRLEHLTRTIVDTVDVRVCYSGSHVD